MIMKIKYTISLIPLLICGFLSGCKNNEPKYIVPNYIVKTLQPYYKMQSEIDDPTLLPEIPVKGLNDASIIEEAGVKLAILNNVSYDKENQPRDLPLDKQIMSSLGTNQIIMFQGHGDFSEIYRSCISTGKEYDYEKAKTDDEYRKDKEEGRLVPLSDFYSDEYITSKYIEKYCGDLSGSIIYLGQCLSASEYWVEEEGKEVSKIDETLVNAFLAKGARTVLAQTRQSQMRYGNVMQFAIMSQLSQINPKTNKLYTISESLEKARNTYGQDDPGSHGVTMIFGDKNFSLL